MSEEWSEAPVFKYEYGFSVNSGTFHRMINVREWDDLRHTRGAVLCRRLVSLWEDVGQGAEQ